MKLRPLQKNVLLKVLAPPEKSAGGIHYVGDAESQKVKRGVVAAIGADIKAGEIAEGNTVLFSAAFGTPEVELNGEKHVLVDYDDIIGVEEG